MLEAEWLSSYSVSSLPPSLYLVPEFISVEEETSLHSHVSRCRWTQLSNRRVQNHGGQPDPKGLLVQSMPNWIQRLVDSINALAIFDENKKANHVLINEYCPGQGILPHLDGDLFSPIVTTLSILSHTQLDFYRPRRSHDEEVEETRKPLFSVHVPRRSLLVLARNMYTDYLHGIEERTRDDLRQCVNYEASRSHEEQCVVERGTRVSFTVRNVPKVAKIKMANLIRL